jgi:hypothetical protein
MPSIGPIPISLSRRGFLKRTAAGTLFLIAARHAFLLPEARARSNFAFENLGARSAATLEAMCDRVIIPARGAPTAREALVPLRIDHEIGLLGSGMASDVRDGLMLVEYSGILEGKFRPFTKLTPGDQDEVLRAMIRSSLVWRRSAFQGLKQLIAFFYYADDRAWRSTGYDGPWVPRRPALSERDFPFPTLSGAPPDPGTARRTGRVQRGARRPGSREKS